MPSENSANYLVPYDEQLANRTKKIRCRRCGHRSYEGLTICPNCGRGLRAARPRWITWGGALMLAALCIATIWGTSGRSPVEWVTGLPERAASLVTNLGMLIEPRVMQPDGVLNQQTTTNQVSAAGNDGSANVGGVSGSENVLVVTPIPGDDSVVQLVDQNDGALQELVSVDGSSAQASSAQTSSESSNDTSESNSDVNPTSTSVPVPKATAVVAKDPTVAPTAVEPTVGPTVKPTSIPTLAPTIEPTAPPTVAPVPQKTYRSDAIVLQAPAAGDTVDCEQDNSLSWRVPISVVATDQYVVNLGYISGQSDNQYIVTWVAKQKLSVEKTSWALDSAYCTLSSDEFNNQWVWYMQVVDEIDEVVSEPSRTSYFVWQKPS